MAAFDAETDLSEDRALRLMINTSVALFWRTVSWNDAEWLDANHRSD